MMNLFAMQHLPAAKSGKHDDELPRDEGQPDREVPVYTPVGPLP
jgi:hypothetical protein